MKAEPPRSSRRTYKTFVEHYRQGKLDEIADDEKKASAPAGSEAGGGDGAPAPRDKKKRREYMREYLRWLKPHRMAVVIVFVLALVTSGLEMVEPLFMRFIIDRVLLNTGLDGATRLTWLNLAGVTFLVVIVA